MNEILEGKKILHLTLKKKWFDMIASGEKKEEYRDLKHYWKTRLEETYYEIDYDCPCDGYKHFDIIEFSNGYNKDAPKIRTVFMGTTIREGRKEWGAEPYKKYYVIKLGEIIKTKPHE